MRVDDFDFDLPEENIALRPARPRDSARLLQVGLGLSDHVVSELPTMLRAGDVLVVNKTEVLPARLYGTRAPRGEGDPVHVEVTLIQPLHGQAWRCFAKPGKRLQPGDPIEFSAGLTATIATKHPSGEIDLLFDDRADVPAALDQAGEMPLPPYIASKRQVDARDRQDYQTMFAQETGSVAAPTAGLHFTPALRESLKEAGITIEQVTLHVGAGTFLPIKTADTADHKMHAEWGRVTTEVADRLNRAKESGGRVIAVGTTSLRLLESAAQADGTIAPFEGDTDIFIEPGYRFRAIDGLMTNFHLPRSTLFMLVSALAGLDVMKAAYAHAIQAGYRFYSYGDASLIWPRGAE